MKLFLLKFVILTVMLLGLPLLGIFAAGYPVARYLEFPPQTRYVVHAPFSWLAFAVIALSILTVVLPLAFKGFQSFKKTPLPIIRSISYQPHTFSLLWFSYIIVVNAMCQVRTGHCLMTDRTGFFLLLFPVSAAFWWFFEYLNRFAQNWFYVGVDFGPWSYFWYATLPFSTVLPAVLSTRSWFLSQNWIRQAYGNFRPLKYPCPNQAAAFVLALSAAGLAVIGIWPNYFFAFLWISPLMIIICLQALMGEPHILSQMAKGEWSGAISAALAATVCGGFWEMWNCFSLAKWQYSIPLVHRFQIFEMPLLGYAGYLPFGLECAVIGSMLEGLLDSFRKK